MVTYPEDWKTYSFRDFFKLIPNNTLSRDKLNTSGDVGDIHYGDVLIKYGDTITDKDSIPRVRGDIGFVANNLLQKNDVVLADTAEDETVGKVSQIGDVSIPLVGGLHTVVCRPIEETADGYLGCYMNSKYYHDQLLPYITGIKVSSVSKKSLGETELIIPADISEQRDIIQEFHCMDTHILGLSELIDKKKNIKEGALHDLISGKTSLKDFSGSRSRVSLSQCVDIFQGGTPRTSNDAYWDGDIVWVTPTEITALNGMYIGESKRKITEEGLNNSSANLLPVGTILLCTRATIGELAISTVPLTTNQGFKNLICKKGYHNVYFAYLLMTLKDEMISRAIGTTFLEISKKELGAIEIEIPEYGEQKAIADILSSMDREIGTLNAEREKMIQIREGAMDDLLTGRIRLTK